MKSDFIGHWAIFRPSPRGQVERLAGRSDADAQQDIDQIGVGVDALQPAGDQQALDDPDALGADFGPGKQPVLLVM